jgi:hypothetical protein
MRVTEQDRYERIGKQLSTIFIVLLAAMFVYGYLLPFVR